MISPATTFELLPQRVDLFAFVLSAAGLGYQASLDAFIDDYNRRLGTEGPLAA